MDFALNDTLRMLDDAARAYAAQRRDPGRRRALVATPLGYSADDWQLMAEMGWLALQLPEDFGGIDGGPLEVMILAEALGGVLAPEPFVSTAVIGALALQRHGSPAQRAELLPQLAQGALRMALADGSRSVRAEARADGWVLHGRVELAIDAPSADRLLVAARPQAGRGDLSLFLVDAHAPGLTRRDFPCADGGRASRVEFSAVVVGPEQCLGAPGAGATLLADLVLHATAALCAEAVGVMQSLHDQTLEYLKTRRQFGRAIGQFQALQHRQVDMLIAVEQSRSLVMAATAALAEGADEAARLVAMAKITVGRCGRVVAQGAVQLHGGIGMTEELAIGAGFKRLAVIDALFGSAEQRLRERAAPRGVAA